MILRTRLFFESAHRLSDYKGKCFFIHGHSFIVDVEINKKKLDKSGFIVDFNDLKKIIEEFDHKLLLKDEPYNRKLFDDRFPKDWIVWFDFNPTCENLSNYMRKKMKKECRLGLFDSIKVRIYETYKPEKTSSVEDIG